MYTDSFSLALLRTRISFSLLSERLFKIADDNAMFAVVSSIVSSLFFPWILLQYTARSHLMWILHSVFINISHLLHAHEILIFRQTKTVMVTVCVIPWTYWGLLDMGSQLMMARNICLCTRKPTTCSCLASCSLYESLCLLVFKKKRNANDSICS